jgi:sulfate permease, SulP family
MALTRIHAPNILRPFRELPASALRAALREGYGPSAFRKDLVAGFVVGVVALPLSMALSIAVGLEPQHGLYTAIIAGFLTALLGGSRTQVVGPTAAFIVVLAPIHARFGLSGLLTAGLLAGIMLIGMALFRMGRLIEFIPHPVTTGFTAGIGTVIALLQLKDLLGLELTHSPEHLFERLTAMWEARGTASPNELLVGLATLGLLVVPRSRKLLVRLPGIVRKIPAPLIALPAAALIGHLMQVSGHPVETIATRFHTIVNGQVIAGVPRQPPLLMWPWQPDPTGAFHPSFATIRALLPGAFAIAMLGAIESLLSAVVADGMARTRHDPDAELFALGVANVATPFFGGIAATGAIARTATNVRAGARSPVAAMVHAGTILVAVMALAPLIGYLPMASLAALLLIVAWNMSELKHVRFMLRVAPGSDIIVLLTCYALTVAIDMVTAVTVGVGLAAVLFIRRMVEVTGGRILGEEEHLTALKRPAPRGVLVYDIAGPLFFGAAQKAMGALLHTADTTRVVIFDLEEVPTVDVTGLVALESVISGLLKDKRYVILSALRSQPAGLLRRAGIVAEHGRLAICPDIDAALDEAERFLATHPR